MPELEELADGIYAHTQADGGWVLSNGGYLRGRRHGTLIDTCGTERRTRTLIDRIRRVGDEPTAIVVNTHHHGDHTYGNCLFPGAHVVAQQMCREDMVATGLAMQATFPMVEWGDIEVRPPTITFEHGLRLWQDDLELQLFHVGPAHTRSDTVVWVPERRVLFAGDVIMGGVTPFPGMGTIRGTLRALDMIRSLDPVVIVPGHGRISGPEVIAEQVEYLDWVLDLARQGRAAGADPLEVARHTDLGRFAEWPSSERLAANLRRGYAELDDGPPPPVDRERAFREMAILAGLPGTTTLHSQALRDRQRKEHVMKPPRFAYTDPQTLDDVLSTLAEYEGQAKVVAGGQSLAPMLNLRLARPELLVDLRHVKSALEYVREDGDVLRIGGLTRQATLERSPLEAAWALIPQAVSHIGHPPIRARGTIGGSLAHADPAAELGAALTALGGHVVLTSSSGTREVDPADLFVSFFMTSIGDAELLTEVVLPRWDGTVGTAFREFARRPGDFAVAGAGVAVTVDADGAVSRAGIGICGAGEVPVDARSAAGALLGQRPDDTLIRDVAQAAASLSRPGEDADYRRHIVATVCAQALKQAIESATRKVHQP